MGYTSRIQRKLIEMVHEVDFCPDWKAGEILDSLKKVPPKAVLVEVNKRVYVDHFHPSYTLKFVEKKEE